MCINFVFLVLDADWSTIIGWRKRRRKKWRMSSERSISSVNQKIQCSFPSSSRLFQNDTFMKFTALAKDQVQELGEEAKEK
jgi:hypothetical protein